MSRLARKPRQAIPTPVAWRSRNGIVVGHDGSVWLWRTLAPQSLKWSGNAARQAHASRLATMLVELGRTGRDPAVKGTQLGAEWREVHFIALNWTEWAEPPADTPEQLDIWLRNVLSFAVGNGLWAVGVRLRRGLKGPSDTLNPLKMLSGFVTDATAGPPDLAPYLADRASIAAILGRAGCGVPTDDEMRRMEQWWKGSDDKAADRLIAMPDGRSLANDYWQTGNLEIAAMAAYDRSLMDSQGLWLADAFGHAMSGCVAASVRCSLVPAKAVRDQMRRAQRKAMNRMAEQAQTGDLHREEDTEMFETANHLEEVFRTGTAPLMRDVSIIMARETDPAVSESYLDDLAARWGLVVKPVEERQISALIEMLPCGKRTVGSTKPFVQDCSIDVFAECGFASFSQVGDTSGVFLGLAPPDLPLVWLDTRGASESDKPATMAVLGDSGSGKTFMLQSLATQASLSGRSVVFVNPKPADSLDGFAAAVGGTTVKISTEEGTEPGQLDPFRFTSPGRAAEILSAHVSGVMSDALSHQERILMEAAFKKAALDGARCAGECLAHPDTPERARELIEAQVRGSALFALAVGYEPGPVMDSTAPGLTLIEFDRSIPTPARADTMSNYEPAVRIAVSAIRLVIQSAMERMFTARDSDGRPSGGVLIIDEAHVLMGSSEGLSLIERLGREGRSQQVLPVLATQRVLDVTRGGADLASYLSRVVALQLRDPDEASAALQLLGLEPDQEKVAILASAGPIRSKDPEGHSRSALAYHSDLHGRKSLITVGPYPDDVVKLFSTNPLDRAERSDGKEGRAARKALA